MRPPTRTFRIQPVLFAPICLAFLFQACSTGYYSTSKSSRSAPGSGATASESTASAHDASDSSGAARKESAEAGDKAQQAKRPEPSPQSGQLSAGQWRDLDNWDFWTKLLHNSEHDWSQFADKWQLDPGGRVSVRLRDENERPVVDATVRLLDGQGEAVWQARTDNRGRATLFDRLDGDRRDGSPTLVVETDASEPLRRDIGYGTTELTVPNSRAVPDDVDVMFTVDTTGSMGDELSYLKSELRNVIERVERNADANLSIRTSVNFYRDTSDQYVVRSHPFTSTIDRSVRQIGEQNASGGGDYPEAVDRALADSIDNHDWSSEARTRLLFLVLDAPPHHNQQTVSSLRKTLRTAARRGVRIVPIASSGVNKETEFLLRASSIASGGTYTFLTDDSGIGNSHIEPTIGDYEVRKLNDLLVDLIGGYVEAPQRPGRAKVN